MTNHPPVNSLQNQLNRASETQFTGPLEVHSENDRKWKIYFFGGHLTWVAGEWHQVRRLFRNLKIHCPKIDLKSLSIREEDEEYFSWDFQILQVLQERQTLTEEQVFAIVESIAMEVLFDILLEESQAEVTYHLNLQDTLSIIRLQSCRLHIDSILPMLQLQVESWKKSGLGLVSPNDAPMLKDRNKQLQRADKVYQKLSSKINGKRTFRELASGFKIDTLKLARVVFPYIKKEWISTRAVPDIPRPTQNPHPSKKRNVIVQPPSSNEPLIACIDDSLQTIKMMEPVIQTAGYRFLAIQDSLQAVLTLIEAKPDLIFLDLVMPVANGYEICTQLRRIPQFAHTPIVILTGNKGIIHRMRASTVRASDFLTKPVQAQKILDVIRKHLDRKSTDRK
ncbi:MAG TPA: response regulator [Oscillatoriales cyanobacterium M59_W2019_021]|nr:MAG: response regulator [Cyanobacteria bacterium J055]HIK31094.1 response regulator [Oscillatoriales cyanobacterium M4454_W2019_049]HIK49704.1 response regulator [Oscillatoriales cyanobacterium M59_W2019_021]